MRDIQARILALHPQARPNVDFIVCADPKRPGEELLTLWNEEALGPRAEAALEAVDLLPAIKASARAQVVAYAQAAGAALTAGYPPAEMQGWPVKEAAARAYLSKAATVHDLAMLRAEADITGETLDALCPSVVAKADRFRVAVGQIAGVRRATVEAIDAAPSAEVVDMVLAAAKAQADAALTALTRAT